MCYILFHFEATIEWKAHYLEGKHLVHESLLLFFKSGDWTQVCVITELLSQPFILRQGLLSLLRLGWNLQSFSLSFPSSLDYLLWDKEWIPTALPLTYLLLLHNGSLRGGEQLSSVAFRSSDPGARASWVQVPDLPFQVASPWVICFMSQSLVFSISRVSSLLWGHHLQKLPPSFCQRSQGELPCWPVPSFMRTMAALLLLLSLEASKINAFDLRIQISLDIRMLLKANLWYSMSLTEKNLLSYAAQCRRIPHLNR